MTVQGRRSGDDRARQQSAATPARSTANLADFGAGLELRADSRTDHRRSGAAAARCRHRHRSRRRGGRSVVERPRLRPASPATSSRASTGGSAYTPVGGLITGTTAVEQTGTNATTFSYQVVAVAAGVTLPAGGPAGPGGVSGHRLPGARRAGVGQHARRSTSATSAPCRSPSFSRCHVAPGDTITGHPHRCGRKDRCEPAAPWRPGPVHRAVPRPARSPTATVTASATAADTLGNTSPPTQSDPMPKITPPPDAPTSVAAVRQIPSPARTRATSQSPSRPPRPTRPPVTPSPSRSPGSQS